MLTAGTRPLLVLISAPSGGGKTTVCQELLKADARLSRAVTCTTRPQRPGEQAGVDYYFLEESVFESRVAAGEFLEHATVYGRSYGTLKSEVLARLREGRDVLLNIDVQGAASVRRRAQEDPVLAASLVSVFLTPATLEELERRLRRRGTESEEAINRRLGNARAEIAEWSQFDYLVVSATIPEDLRRMQVILEAERMRVKRSLLPG